MKRYALIFASLVFSALNARAAALTEPAYNFDPQKLAVAEDAFHFLRSYVDYYYLLVRANSAQLPTLTGLENVAGWCVGDAHPENFGAILLGDGRSIFTVNDVDDAGPCPVVLDLARLMVSSRLANPSASVDDLKAAYVSGLNGQAMAVPSAIADLLQKSQEKGTIVSIDKIADHHIVREPNMEEVTPIEIDAIRTALTGILPGGLKLLDQVSTRKVGGGSGGLLRYELLVSFPSIGELHLELKEEVAPGISSVATVAVPSTHDRILSTLQIEQEGAASPYYNVLTVMGRDFYLRPHFGGNISVKLDDEGSHDERKIFAYEAYTLGRLHTRSITDVGAWSQRLAAVPTASLEADISSLVAEFQNQFNKLKGAP